LHPFLFAIFFQVFNEYQFQKITQIYELMKNVSNCHSPQICVTRLLLMRICRGKSHFFQKWPLANVGKSGESEQNRLANVGKSGKSEQNRLANVGESGESLPSLGKFWRMIR
jgi:hypothetical protein